MALSTTSDLKDIQEYIKNIVLAHKPNANMERGFPLWDLLIEPFAKLVFNERLYVNLTGNLARVLPLFDSTGALIDNSNEDYLANKYFVGGEDIQGGVFTLYLFFDQKCDFTIKGGSKVGYNDLTFDIDPLFVSKDDSEWLQNTRGHYYPVAITSSENANYFVSNTEGWDTELLNLNIQGTAEFLFAFNTDTISSSEQPTLTLDVLRNSISNRSMSNTRAIGYHLRANSGFYPDSLKKYEVLKFADIHYIDNYFEYLREGSNRIVFKTSGEGKVLLDYGTSYYSKAVTLEYLPEGHNLAFAQSSIVQKDVSLQVGALNIYGGSWDNTDQGDLYWGISEVNMGLGEKRFAFKLFRDEAGTQLVASIGTSLTDDYLTYFSGEHRTGVYLEVFERNSSGLNGYAHLHYKHDVVPSQNNKITGLLSPDYKIQLNSQDGVIYPAAIFLSSDDLASTQADLLVNNFNQYESSTAPESLTKPVLAFENSKFTFSDPSDQISKVDLVGMSPNNTDLFKLYLVSDAEAGGTIYLYKSATLEADSLVATGVAPLSFTEQVIPLSGVYSSGISGTITCTLVSHISGPVAVWPDNMVTGFSNNTLFVRPTIQRGSVSQYHNQTAYLVYLGTDPSKLGSANSILNDDANIEITAKTKVGVYRPFACSIQFNGDYVFPFKNNTEVKANYMRLLELMDTFFSDFTGSVGELDFSSLGSRWFDETGLYVKKLDWKLYTQRGHTLTGELDLSDTDQIRIDWVEDVLKPLEDTVDTLYLENIVKESTTTVERLYKPILVRFM